MQVGKTPLRQIPELCNLYGLPKLYIKDESANPTGTWKDRRSEAILKKAKAEGRDHLALISNGNAAYALAHAVRYDGNIAGKTRIQVSAIVPLDLPSVIAREIEKLDARIIRADLNQPLSAQQVVNLTRRDSKDLPMIVTNHFHNAYINLFDEIINDLGPDNPPDFILAPVGSGEGFTGIYEGDMARQRRLYADPVQVYGINPYEKNSFADKLNGFDFSPYPQIWSIIPGVRQKIKRISEEPIQPTYKIISKYMLAEPSAAVAFCGINIVNPDAEDTVVVINSGRGLTI